MSYLDLVNSPDDLKKMNMDEMKVLADEIRQAILNRDSKIGGHVGPNLGIVETTIALHYVFDTPRDKIVWDVSHQCYPHKMLTGRKEGFLTAEGMAKISGYTNQDESEHDFFKVGHTSTSVSLACGLAKARDLLKQKHNVIAVIGDGSLSGGEAMEGFNNAAVLDSNIIIIVNDNEMSIAENHGGLYKNLHLLRETKGQAECNMFKALGFEYLYVDDGNNLADMIAVLKKVKDVKVPLVLHIHTLKGMGYELAEKNKEQWHWNFPFDIKTGKTAFEMPEENYNDITYDYLEKKIAKDKSIIVVNAATSGVFGLSPERRAKLGENFVDVGIAEEHAVTFAAGLSAQAVPEGAILPLLIAYSIPFAATMIRAYIGLAGFFLALVLFNKDGLAQLNRAVHDRKAMGCVLGSTIFGPFLGVSASLLATLYTSAGIAQTIFALTPILIIAPSALLFHQKVTAREVIGAVISVIGVAMFFV